MKTFIITADNKVSVSSADEALLPEVAVKFATQKELSTVAANWSASRLVEVWNNLPGAKSVRKFRNREAAVGRICEKIQELETAGASLTVPGAERDSTEAGRVILLLKQPTGATRTDILAAVGVRARK